MLKFITGNKNKVLEAGKILNPFKIEQLNINLLEIQEIDSKKIIEHKLKEASKHSKGNFFIDDSSLYFSCLNYHLPGPLIKWYLDTIGVNEIYKMCKSMGDFKAKAVTHIGYMDKNKKITYFAGVVEGIIVQPKGNYKFGYNEIFIPKNYSKTLAEMTESENLKSSPRGVALLKFKKFLISNKYV